MRSFWTTPQLRDLHTIKSVSNRVGITWVFHRKQCGRFGQVSQRFQEHVQVATPLRIDQNEQTPKNYRLRSLLFDRKLLRGLHAQSSSGGVSQHTLVSEPMDLCKLNVGSHHDRSESPRLKLTSASGFLGSDSKVSN